MIILVCSFKLSSFFNCIQLQILYCMIQSQGINSANHQPSYTSSSGQKCVRLDPSGDTGASSVVIYVMLRRSEMFCCYTRPVISLSGFSIISNILEISRANSEVLSPKISASVPWPGFLWPTLALAPMWSSAAPWYPICWHPLRS